MTDAAPTQALPGTGESGLATTAKRSAPTRKSRGAVVPAVTGRGERHRGELKWAGRVVQTRPARKLPKEIRYVQYRRNRRQSPAPYPPYPQTTSQLSARTEYPEFAGCH
jgi:hypothetical protein